MGREPGPDLRPVLGPVVLGSAATAYLGTLPEPVTPDAGDGPAQHRDPVSRRAGAALATAVAGALVVAAVVAIALSGLGSDPPRHPATEDGPADATTGTTPGGVLADPVATARDTPTSSPTAAATLAGTTRSTDAIAASATRDPSPTSTASAQPSPRGASADVGVAARSSSSLPRSYDVDNTQHGVPAGRTTSLVVHGSQGVVLSSADMTCTGGGSSTLRCTVGSGTTKGSFSAVNLGIGTGHVTLRIAPVEGYTDPWTSNNATTLTLA